MTSKEFAQLLKALLAEHTGHAATEVEGRENILLVHSKHGDHFWVRVDVGLEAHRHA